MELIVTAFIVAVGILALLSAFVTGLELLESGRNLSQARADAQVVLEQIRSEVSGTSAFNTVRGRSAQQWNTWVSGLNLSSLDQEQIQVIPGPANQDPWPVAVSVQWRQQAGRLRQIRVDTLLTYRTP